MVKAQPMSSCQDQACNSGTFMTDMMGLDISTPSVSDCMHVVASHARLSVGLPLVASCLGPQLQQMGGVVGVEDVQLVPAGS